MAATKQAKPVASRVAAGGARAASWKCPRCGRSFNQKNQRHACGTGDRTSVLRNRPASLVRLYTELEAFVHTLGPVEVVARERYVLLRTTRIFADLVMMTDAVRVAVHLKRAVSDPLFFKVASDARQASHVTKLRAEKDLVALKPYLREAYQASLAAQNFPR
jgi:hypothetical protein